MFHAVINSVNSRREKKYADLDNKYEVQKCDNQPGHG